MSNCACSFQETVTSQSRHAVRGDFRLVHAKVEIHMNKMSLGGDEIGGAPAKAGECELFKEEDPRGEISVPSPTTTRKSLNEIYGGGVSNATWNHMPDFTSQFRNYEVNDVGATRHLEFGEQVVGQNVNTAAKETDAVIALCRLETPSTDAPLQTILSPSTCSQLAAETKPQSSLSQKRKSGNRNQYLCSKCGEPKRGHICSIATLRPTLFGTGIASSPTAISPGPPRKRGRPKGTRILGKSSPEIPGWSGSIISTISPWKTHLVGLPEELWLPGGSGNASLSSLSSFVLPCYALFGDIPHMTAEPWVGFSQLHGVVPDCLSSSAISAGVGDTWYPQKWEAGGGTTGGNVVPLGSCSSEGGGVLRAPISPTKEDKADKTACWN